MLEGGFYAQELQKVNKVDNLYRIEEIVDERKNAKGVMEVKVKWFGYPSKFNIWMLKKDLVDYKNRRQT